MALFGKGKFPIPVTIFRPAAAGGLDQTNTMGAYRMIKGNKRLVLRSGLIIKMENTSKIKDTHYTFTPDEKVYFPIKIRRLSDDLIEKLKKGEKDNALKINEILSKPTKDELHPDTMTEEEKEEAITKLRMSSLSKEDRDLIKEYTLDFDIIPDPVAYEVFSQQLEEAIRTKNQRKKNALDRFMPVIMAVGLAVAFAIIAYATINYVNNFMSSSGSVWNGIVNSLHSVATQLGNIATNLGNSAAATTGGTTPAP